MKWKLLNDQAEKTYALVFDKNEEFMSRLLAFAKEQTFDSSHFTAIGGFSGATLGYFNRENKQYLQIPIKEQVEVLSLIGDIALDKGQPKVHAHVVIGYPDGIAHGGHLLEAVVWPTLEVILTESATFMKRKIDPETGLALIDLDASFQVMVSD